MSRSETCSPPAARVATGRSEQPAGTVGGPCGNEASNHYFPSSEHPFSVEHAPGPLAHEISGLGRQCLVQHGADPLLRDGIGGAEFDGEQAHPEFFDHPPHLGEFRAGPAPGKQG